MALSVSTAPRYNGTLGVGSGNSTPGNLQGGAGANYFQPTYNPQQPVPQSGGGVLAYRTPAPTGPSPTQIAATNAANAEQTRMDNARRGFGVEQQGLQSGYRTKATDNTNSYRTQGQGFTNGLRTGQNTINTGNVNNALNLRRGMSSIAGDVRQGIKSGGVTLANMNATDSSAAGALARAWATMGNSQAASARNQAQLQSNTLNTDQANLNITENQGWANLQNWKATETNRISTSLFDALKVLDNKTQNEGVGGMVDMGYRDRLIADATAELNAIDGTVRNELNAINGLTPEQIQQQAIQQDEAGVAGINPFAIEPVATTAPGAGAPISQLPIFRRPEEEQAVTPQLALA